MHNSNSWSVKCTSFIYKYDLYIILTPKALTQQYKREKLYNLFITSKMVSLLRWLITLWNQNIHCNHLYYDMHLIQMLCHNNLQIQTWYDNGLLVLFGLI